jgi:hypothetical protein
MSEERTAKVFAVCDVCTSRVEVGSSGWPATWTALEIRDAISGFTHHVFACDGYVQASTVPGMPTIPCKDILGGFRALLDSVHVFAVFGPIGVR